MKKIFLLSCIGVLALMQVSMAEGFNNDNEDPSFNIGLKAGTLGLGLDVSKPINDLISIRFNANTLNYNTTDNSLYNSILKTDKKYQLDTKGLLFDFHLLQLRLTAGAYINNNAFIYTTKPKTKKPVMLNGIGYEIDTIENIETTVTFNKISPYVGVGWGNNGNREGWGGWNLTLDIGLMYHGDPQVDIKAKINDSVPKLAQHVINAGLKLESKKQEKDFSKYPFYPVIMVGLNYSF